MMILAWETNLATQNDFPLPPALPDVTETLLKDILL
jgi:hypothetical protein